MSIFNKLHDILNRLEDGLKERTDLAEGDEEQPAAQPKKSTKTAVDNAENAAKMIVRRLREDGFMGSSNPDIRRLEVLVVDDEYGNPRPWAGPDFLTILQNRLDAGLMGFLKPEYGRLKSDGSRAGLIEVDKDLIYLRLAGQGSGAGGPRLALRLVAGTGSSNREVHVLDPEVSLEYFIGRGRPTGTDDDKSRIFILEDEPDIALKERNGCVSHNQGMIFYNNGSWELVRTPGASSINYTLVKNGRLSTCYPLSNIKSQKLEPGMRVMFGGKDVTFKVESAPEKED